MFGAKKQFYTYCHTRNDNGLIFYIGKGTKNRLNHKTRNIYWKNIVNKHGFIAEILAYWDTEQEAFDHEQLLINCFKDMGYKLANLTNGGGGISGYAHTDGAKEKISVASKKRSQESIEKIRQATKARWANPEFKEKTIKAMKSAITPEWLKKVSRKGKTHTEETKRKIAETEKLTKNRSKLCSV
jgi:hypothetical protein